MLKDLLIFAGGVGIGCVATYFGMKTKYDKIISDEIAEIKESYSQRIKEVNENADKIVEAKMTASVDISKDENILKNLASKYTADNPEEPINYTEKYKAKEEEPTKEERYPWGPESNDEEETLFGETCFEIPESAYDDEDDGYDKDELMLTTDKILIDMSGHEVSADELVGLENIAEFAYGDKESIYIRNQSLETDYKVVKSKWDFMSVRQEE